MALLVLAAACDDMRRVDGSPLDLERRTVLHAPELVGAEDVAGEPGSADLYVSADPRDGTPGRIFRVSGSPPDLWSASALEIDPGENTDFSDADFYPHGIDLFVTASGERRLFVINHRRKTGSASTVEIFRIEESKLVLLRSVRGETELELNDVVAAGDESFYATAPGSALSILLGLAGGGLVHFAPETAEGFRSVARGLAFPNGIEIHPREPLLFVALSQRGGRIATYRIAERGALEPLARSRRTGIALDNLRWSRDGKLLVAGHDSGIAFVAHSFDHDRPSPCTVLELSLLPSGLGVGDEARIVFRDSGAWASGCSVAAIRDRDLVIGTVFLPGLRSIPIASGREAD